MSISSPNTLGY